MNRLEEKVVIGHGVRTAIGNFGGSLKEVPTVELGSVVITGMFCKVVKGGIQPANRFKYCS